MKIFLMYLKERIVNNKSIIFILISVFIFIFCFLTIKNSYFNEIINYMETYINYYVAKYLQGDYTSLIVSSNMPLSIFVENDVVGILSAPYLYCFMHSNTIFSIYLFVLPFIIFKYINNIYYDDVHNGFANNVILKIGKKKYIRYTLSTNCILGGILAVVPKIIYYIFLLIFYYPSFSHKFVINNYNFINNRALEIFQIYNPISLVIGDIVMSLFYGVVVALISTIIILLSKKKINTYLIFILVMVGQSIIFSLLENISSKYILSSMFSYYSIYSVLNVWLESRLSIVWSLVPIIVLTFILIIITMILLKRKLKDSYE